MTNDIDLPGFTHPVSGAQSAFRAMLAAMAVPGSLHDAGIGLIPRSAESTQGISADYLRQLIKEQQELAATYGPEYSKVKELQEQIAAVGQRTREAMRRLDGGEIMEAKSLVLDAIIERARELSFAPSFDAATIIEGELGEYAAAAGAALLAV